MAEPARKSLKIAKDAKIGCSSLLHISTHHDSMSGAETSGDDLPHKLRSPVALLPRLKSDDAPESDGGRLRTPGENSNRIQDNIPNQGADNLHASKSDSGQHDIYKGETTDDDTSLESALSTANITVISDQTQGKDSNPEKPAVKKRYTKEEVEALGAIIYREADAALRGLVDSESEDSHVSEESGSMACAGPIEQGNTVNPHDSCLEPRHIERDMSRPPLSECDHFQDYVNNLLAEYYNQSDDNIDDFGLSTLRRRPLREWYQDYR
ncbi:hypothetical protein BDV25DRAFT_158958 [Aspergillus avenaceus]|uniref:Uncharacterized protein n=1 Tax=Aspergillus avenaceus TaxID=36643 RepID=A0A5N6TP44_ASPAV|nr:hypothetical protein BDV25DRAFT_158958 [Aspergillus avenaceus]